jgi:hypothetical protein
MDRINEELEQVILKEICQSRTYSKSFEAIFSIVVYNQKTNDYISSVLKKNNIILPVKTELSWYYK